MHSITTLAAVERRFGTALAASLAIHAGAMTLSPPAPPHAAAEAPVPLQVRFAELPPPPRPLALPPEPKKRVPPVAAKPKAVKAPAVPKAPAVVAQAPKPAASVEETPAPVAAPVEPAPALPPPPPVVTAVAPAPPAPRISAAELLAGYGKTVSQELTRYRSYPRVAQMRGWEGAVLMELRVAPSGRLLGAELHTSSGYPVLDEQALAMAARAAQLPAPPEGLRDGAIAILVPVVFRLTP